ncbi:DUF7577 domain-containing protein [Natronomonas amylolytica]|uniref:DUF7577 domain-containing protein n=1 Tax=Natronomonas amylolytica TaxID=3108498 RepID=UPI00300B552C
MFPSGELYVAITALLLLIALGAAIPVLKGIVLDGIERRRTRETTETEPADDSTGNSGPHVVCSACGTPNDPNFSYCRACGTRL